MGDLEWIPCDCSIKDLQISRDMGVLGLRDCWKQGWFDRIYQFNTWNVPASSTSLEFGPARTCGNPVTRRIGIAKTIAAGKCCIGLGNLRADCATECCEVVAANLLKLNRPNSPLSVESGCGPRRIPDNACFWHALSAMPVGASAKFAGNGLQSSQRAIEFSVPRQPSFRVTLRHNDQIRHGSN